MKDLAILEKTFSFNIQAKSVSKIPKSDKIKTTWKMVLSFFSKEKNIYMYLTIYLELGTKEYYQFWN